MVKKAKYHLSEEGMKELNRRLEKLAKEAHTDVQGLQDGVISVGLVEKITKVTGLLDVIDRNEQLSKAFSGFINMYGFDSLYDLYMYAKSCEIHKSKDYSKLVPVKRTVVRNGKETEITVYEDPNKDSDGTDRTKEGTGGGGVRHARDFRKRVHRKKDSKDTSKVAKLKQAVSSMPSSNKQTFKDTSDYYIELLGEGGETVGVIGYSEEGEYLTMDFYRSNGEVSGIAARGLSEMINIAVEENKGVKVEDDVQGRPVFAKFGLTQEGNFWAVSAEDLQRVFNKNGTEDS